MCACYDLFIHHTLLFFRLKSALYEMTETAMGINDPRLKKDKGKLTVHTDKLQMCPQTFLSAL